MSIDLELDATQRAIADSVAALCRDRCDDDAVRDAAGRLPWEMWRPLAELGVLALATPEGEGGALEVVAAMEPLGRAVFPGPLAETFRATQLLPEKERVAVAAGESLVSLGRPPLLPWAGEARVFVEVDGDRAWLARVVGPVEAVETLGGEVWGRVALARERELAGATRAAALGDAALAAYLAAAGRRLVDDACEHARTRRQFGRPLGDFQAVAHPLADCAMALDAAAGLARAAACRFDALAAADGLGDVPGHCAAARLSARRAALQAAHVGHQVFGALGVTLEGPVFHVSRRIRQLATVPPGGADPARERVLGLFGL